MSEDLSAVEEWAGALLAQLDPGERRRLARLIGRDLTKSQRSRIRANLNPDGSAYEPRRPRPSLRDRKGAIRRAAKSGAMFRKLTRANELGTLRVTADQVDVGFKRSRTAEIARVHQLGLVDQIERKPDAPSIRYPKRQLLGFTAADREHLADLILAHLAV